MVDENNIPDGNATGAATAAQQINVLMQWGEQGGLPVYSNFSVVNNGKGTIIVDFGFVDPNAVNALNRAIQSGEKTSDTLNARLSCRMALNPETAYQLAQQLNQLLQSGATAAAYAPTSNANADAPASTESASAAAKSDETANQKSERSGFRFPWSKKK